MVPDVSRPATHSRARAAAFGGACLDYQGGPVMHTNRTHVIFWNPSNSLSWDPGYQAGDHRRFCQNVAADSHKATNVYSLTAQYTRRDRTRVLRLDATPGAIDDTDPAPAERLHAAVAARR